MIPRRSPVRRSTKPIRPRKHAQVRIGKVTGTVRLSGAALERLREKVYQRDGGRCQWASCGVWLPLYGSVFTRGHMAHLLSRGAGGGDTLENCRLLCPKHHLGDEHTRGLTG